MTKIRSALALLLLLAFIARAHGGENTTGAKFSALEFFEVIDPAIKRNPLLPGRVTLESADLSVEELENLLIGSWKVQITCSGRPLTSRATIFTTIADGVTKEAAVVQFFQDKRFERRFTRGALQTQADFSDPGVTNRGQWSVQATKTPGVFIVDLENAELLYLTLRLYVIKETGEYIIVDESPSKHVNLCDPGENYWRVYSQEPNS